MVSKTWWRLDRLRRSSVVLLHDLAMVPVAWVGAYWLRFNLGVIPAEFLSRAIDSLPVVITLQALGFIWFGMYRGVWRFASLPDLVRILKAVGVGAALCLGALFLVYRLEDVPRSVPLLYALLLVILLSGPRFLYRWSRDRHMLLGAGERVLIVGAGQAGEMLARDMLRGSIASYQPVAFVDDKPRRQGQEIHGISVVAGCDDIPEVARRLDIDLIMLAVPSAPSSEMRRLVELCERGEVPFRTLPNLEALLTGQVSVNELREVSIEDILGREAVSLDWEGIGKGLSGKRVLVTGGGGSIGSELCEQIAKLGPTHVVLVENGEYNLYAAEMELRRRYPEVALDACLADVRDQAAMEWLFAAHKPEVVFHAAAYKHVPLLEGQIREAAQNNILGTRVVAQAADRHGCSEFVLISTDKAVNPANVMGACKRVAEIYCQNLNARSDTRFITVRFGNVLGSAGSVVPLFRRQIASGGPVTVTHPDIERYFMTIPEACQLIMQAAVIGEGGEIFVLDMGEPTKISYLAEQMIRLSGKEPGTDIEISYTGLRPGEKLYEELFHEREPLEGTGHDKILLARYRQVAWDALESTLDDMAAACEVHDVQRLGELLSRLVPERRTDELSSTAGVSDAAIVVGTEATG